MSVARLTPLAAAVVSLALTIPSHHPAHAQNEPEPESTPIESPQAEPTEYVPVTAGDAERAAASPTPEVAASPTSEETPTEPASPSPEATAQPTPTGAAAHHRKKEVQKAKLSKPEASKPGSPGQVVPENSPFAGLNFGNQKGPTDIKSDTGTLDYQKKVAIFSGHVHAVQAGGDLTSDQLKVQYGKDFNDIQMMYADGNVRMSQGTRWITSDHAVLNQGTHVLTFIGNPVAHDGQDQITGSTIKVDLISGKSTVDKPRLIIFPREGKNPDNGEAPESP